MSPWYGILDLLTAIAALIVSTITLPSAWWIGTWLVWAPGYATAVAATIPAWLRSVFGALAIAVLLSLVYVATALPGNTDQLLALGNNALSYIYFAGAGIMFVRFAQRLANLADEHQARAAQLEQELKTANFQYHIHNASGLLATLARDDIPPEVLNSLRKQADEEANRLRNEALQVQQAGTHSDAAHIPLNDTVTAAVQSFSHLPLTLRTTLGAGVELPRDDALLVEKALVSLLFNVQFHANATEVVIHTDQGENWWEVSVADNGKGFIPDDSKYGFGLGTQVIGATEARNIAVKIQSAPGEGTIIELRGEL